MTAQALSALAAARPFADDHSGVSAALALIAKPRPSYPSYRSASRLLVSWRAPAIQPRRSPIALPVQCPFAITGVAITHILRNGSCGLCLPSKLLELEQHGEHALQLAVKMDLVAH
jgi:hypothetical protein